LTILRQPGLLISDTDGIARAIIIWAHANLGEHDETHKAATLLFTCEAIHIAGIESYEPEEEILKL
jgi:hypothetical protein